MYLAVRTQRLFRFNFKYKQKKHILVKVLRKAPFTYYQLDHITDQQACVIHKVKGEDLNVEEKCEPIRELETS